MIDNVDSAIYLWSPDQTPAMFPPPGSADKHHRSGKGQRKHPAN